jgi:hypothetical protein
MKEGKAKEEKSLGLETITRVHQRVTLISVFRFQGHDNRLDEMIGNIECWVILVFSFLSSLLSTLSLNQHKREMTGYATNAT